MLHCGGKESYPIPVVFKDYSHAVPGVIDVLQSFTTVWPDTLLNVFLAIAVDNLANAQELTKV